MHDSRQLNFRIGSRDGFDYQNQCSYRIALFYVNMYKNIIKRGMFCGFDVWIISNKRKLH